jgi:hypothetical protein
MKRKMDNINMYYLRNKSWKPKCVLSFNIGWRILVFYPEPKARKYPPTHVKSQNTFWLDNDIND